MTDHFACPVCQQVLHRLGQQWSCENRHCFDVARKGYVNLLLAHEKVSRDPGDGMLMVESRRAFLDTGHYALLSERMNALVAAAQPKVLLDAGCGEGYFLYRLGLELPLLQRIGIDISKNAINAAAQRDKLASFAVASTFHLPIVSHSVDCLLRIMAPGAEAEAARVLKDGGLHIIVAPGPDHLFGLKQLIYASTDKNSPKLAPANGFELIHQEQVTFTLELYNESIWQLLLMTPYYWSIDAATRAKVATTKELVTSVDFSVSVLRKLYVL